MKYVIDSAECDKIGISFSSFLYLLSVYSNNLITESSHYEAANKSMLTFRGRDTYGNPIYPKLTEYGSEIIETILKNSEKQLPTDEEISIIANSLREIYPQGKKPSTPYYWRDSAKGIELRLKQFFIKYGSKYTDEQILNAARDYVDGFHGDYRYMRLLKYFIWKKDEGNGEVSELASCIDNAGQESVEGDSWINELV